MELKQSEERGRLRDTEGSKPEIPLPKIRLEAAVRNDRARTRTKQMWP